MMLLLHIHCKGMKNYMLQIQLAKTDHYNASRRGGGGGGGGIVSSLAQETCFQLEQLNSRRTRPYFFSWVMPIIIITRETI